MIVYEDMRKHDKAMIRLLNIMYKKHRRKTLFFLDKKGFLKRHVYEYLNDHCRYV